MVAELTKDGLYRFAWRLRDQLHIEAPVDAKRLIMEHCRIPLIVYMRWDSPRIGGMLYARGSTTTVALNVEHSPRQQNFYALHEFMHYMMHSPDDVTTFCGDTIGRDSVLEWQANEAAAELLAPMHRLLPEYRAMWEHCLKNRKPGPDMELYIASLANLFQVTEDVIRNRFDSLGYEIEQHINGVPLEGIEILSNRQKEKNKIRYTNPIERMDKRFYEYWRFREGREAKAIREKLLSNACSRFRKYGWFTLS